MNDAKLSTLFKVVFFVYCVIFPPTAFSEVIFEDNFDAHPDWSPTQQLGSGIQAYGDPSAVPQGWHSFRVAASKYSSVGHNTINIDSTNFRGSSGKAFTFWGESADAGWTSDGMLSVLLPSEYTELYVAFYIKFQGDWRWKTGTSSGQKFFRITHYWGGNPYQFFQTGNQRPLSTLLFYKYGGGTANVAAVTNYRYENTYYPTSATPPHSSSAIGFMGTGSYSGTGDTFWDFGMIGDGEWHRFDYYIKLNSAVGTPDGRVKFWIDSALITDVTDLAFGDVGAQESPRRGWNYVMLGGNNINSYAPASEEQEQWYAIDDLVISTSYIGPGAPDTTPPLPPANAR